MEEEVAIIYAQLALYNMQNSGNEQTPRNLKIFMEAVFELYPTVYEVEERLKELKNAKKI